jgi:hypothetical protein
VLYCSLEEELAALVRDPEVVIDRAFLSESFKHLMYIHKREGCTLSLANGRDVVVPPGEQKGQIAAIVRKMCSYNGGIISEAIAEHRAIKSDQFSLMWERHLLRDQISLSLGQRWWIAFQSLREQVLGGAPLPPLH